MAEAIGASPVADPPFDAVTSYANGRLLAEWFASARVGEKAIYAVGPALDHRHSTDLLVQRWQRAGKVKLLQQPGADGRRLRHIVERTETSSRMPSVEPVDDESVEGRILTLLRRCANLGLACPSHEDIAERLNLRDRKKAEYATRRLRDAGLIRVDWPARSGPRVVTIVATGKSTSTEWVK